MVMIVFAKAALDILPPTLKSSLIKIIISFYFSIPKRERNLCVFFMPA
jgi:hypothetical protein